VIEAEDVEALNSFVLHYGPTLEVQVRPATDVGSAIKMLQSASSGAKRRPRASNRR
jgi:hypothetical protein